jgi:Carboxypeptidase regulatory-like domain/TonB dependent receptor
MSKILQLSFAAFLVLAISVVAFGQSSTTGAIGGVVTNPNREVVPGASITVKNIGTNKEDAGTTDDQGRYRIVNLQPGTYTTTINASGFTPYTKENVVVEVGLVTTVDAPMSIGPIQPNTVEVTSEAPVINVSQQDFSSNVNQTQINNLPINGSRWSNFALLNPGSVPDGNFGLISFRGISGLLNNNTIDGADNNQAFFSEERGRTRLSYTVSQSAVREFQANTSNYSAEYGRAAGGVVNAVTKSGTNDFHGSAEYYQRNAKWGARNPLGTVSQFSGGVISILPFKGKDVRHTIRGTIGGPIKKDKLFFFFSYDEQRRNFPGLGIFSTSNYLTTVNRTTLKAAPRNLTDAQIDSAISFLNSLTGPVPRKGNQRIFLPKIDWHISENHVLTGSYNRLRWQSPAGIQTQPTNTRGRASFGDDFVNNDYWTFRLASTFGPNLVNEARFQYGRDNEFEFSQPPLPGEPTTAPAYPGVTAAGTRSPDVFLTNGIEFGTPTFLERPAFPDEKRWQYADTVTLTAGNHTFKWGGDINRVLDLQDNLRNFAGAYSYNNINDFIIDHVNFITPGGLPATVTCTTGQPASPAPAAKFRGRCYTSNYAQGFGPTKFSFVTTDYNLFVQDDWRYTPRLTINIGLRYEYERLPDPFLPSSEPRTNNFPKDKNNFGPRIGFAWDMGGNGKNSLRGGYGIYYGRIINSTILNALTNTGNSGGQFQASVAPTITVSGVVVPNPAAPVYPNTLASGPAGTGAIQFFQNHFQAPMIHQMDLIYEREIARNTVASVSMLMSFGRNLPAFVDVNLRPSTTTATYSIVDGPFAGQTYTVPVFTGSRPISSFGAMTEIRSIVGSRYYGFVAQLNRRFTKGLQLQLNYTRSRAHDDGQVSATFTDTNDPFDAFNPLAEKGISNFDVPNKFVANAVYQPHFNVSKGAGAIVNGWELSPIVSAYSGVPFTPSISGSIPTQGGTAIPSTPAGGQNGSGGSTRFALVPRNSFRFPKIVNVDLRVSRRVHFNESTALEFLVEGFNVFNRTQVTGINNQIYRTAGTANAPQLCSTTCSSPLTNFGTISAAGGTLFRERQVQMAVRFQF